MSLKSWLQVISAFQSGKEACLEAVVRHCTDLVREHMM